MYILQSCSVQGCIRHLSTAYQQIDMNLDSVMVRANRERPDRDGKQSSHTATKRVGNSLCVMWHQLAPEHSRNYLVLQFKVLVCSVRATMLLKVSIHGGMRLNLSTQLMMVPPTCFHTPAPGAPCCRPCHHLLPHLVHTPLKWVHQRHSGHTRHQH